MKLFLSKIEKLNFGWNEKPLGEDDFYCQCKSHNIEIIETPMKIRGICWYVQEQHVITINSKLSGHDRLLAMWHEFGHYLMHFPNKTIGTYFWGDELIYKGNRRQENEADTFALCALIPKVWVYTKSLDDFVEEENFSEEMVWKRKSIYERYKI